MHDYQLAHPHTPVREQEVPEMACNAWIKACTPANVLAGFRSTGIWPIKRDIFTDLDFMGSTVTEREPPTLTTEPASSMSSASGQASPSRSASTDQASETDDQVPTDQASKTDDQVPTSAVSPESVRPYPKAPARPQGKGRARKALQCRCSDPL